MAAQVWQGPCGAAHTRYQQPTHYLFNDGQQLLIYTFFIKHALSHKFAVLNQNLIWQPTKSRTPATGSKKTYDADIMDIFQNTNTTQGFSPLDQTILKSKRSLKE